MRASDSDPPGAPGSAFSSASLQHLPHSSKRPRCGVSLPGRAARQGACRPERARCSGGFYLSLSSIIYAGLLSACCLLSLRCHCPCLRLCYRYARTLGNPVRHRTTPGRLCPHFPSLPAFQGWVDSLCFSEAPAESNALQLGGLGPWLLTLGEKQPFHCPLGLRKLLNVPFQLHSFPSRLFSQLNACCCCLILNYHANIFSSYQIIEML